MTDRQYLFVFESNVNARIFVHRLVLQLRHLAICVVDESVIVIDGNDEPRRARIFNCARTISAQMAAVDGSTENV